jgi:hypothetical protein
MSTTFVYPAHSTHYPRQRLAPPFGLFSLSLTHHCTKLACFATVKAICHGEKKKNISTKRDIHSHRPWGEKKQKGLRPKIWGFKKIDLTNQLPYPISFP